MHEATEGGALTTASVWREDAGRSGTSPDPVRHLWATGNPLLDRSILLYVIDHIYISVSDVPRSLAFYAATLAPLGWRELGNYDSSAGPADVPDLFGLADEAYGSGTAVGFSIWLRQRQSGETGLYVGFVADNEAEVNAAYAAAIEAGGRNEGEPAVREYFGPSYYAANVADFDGNRLEIVHKSFNPPSRRHRT
jgi:catechol 2,3-dioxygenase-like lactoylglutathione lyase family enzyme